MTEDFYLVRMGGEVSSGSNSSSDQNKQNATFTNEEAKQIALHNAGLAENQVSELKVDQDQQDDSPVYKINFKYGECGYSYVVSAVNGSILEIDNDTDNSSSQSNQTNSSSQTNQTSPSSETSSSSQSSQGSTSSSSTSSQADDQAGDDDSDYDGDHHQDHHDGDDDDEDLNDEYE